MLVKNAMTVRLVTVGPRAPLSRALALMDEHSVTTLPVVTPEVERGEEMDAEEAERPQHECDDATGELAPTEMADIDHRLVDTTLNKYECEGGGCGDAEGGHNRGGGPTPVMALDQRPGEGRTGSAWTGRGRTGRGGGRRSPVTR